jgi:hypothetical protein
MAGLLEKIEKSLIDRKRFAQLAALASVYLSVLVALVATIESQRLTKQSMILSSGAIAYKGLVCKESSSLAWP